jgi:hypothetical protein
VVETLFLESLRSRPKSPGPLGVAALCRHPPSHTQWKKKTKDCPVFIISPTNSTLHRLLFPSFNSETVELISTTPAITSLPLHCHFGTIKGTSISLFPTASHCATPRRSSSLLASYPRKDSPSPSYHHRRLVSATTPLVATHGENRRDLLSLPEPLRRGFLSRSTAR